MITQTIKPAEHAGCYLILKNTITKQTVKTLVTNFREFKFLKARALKQLEVQA